MLILLTFLAFFMRAVSSRADDKAVATEELPPLAKSFVMEYFPEGIVTNVRTDERNSPAFEVFLDNGVEIDFNHHGYFDKVATEGVVIPAALIPVLISNYVQDNFPGAKVMMIDKESHGYKVGLSNGYKLKFNKKGAFISMDE